ncbi:hypothetical protein E2C01_009139 [Portunus trituberculatus]|uniref:Uncharacterized protein n=1 Tax=Portunus trituberculatus TaxID=210409 RepID=A0A5B7D2N5_PORTR|nr:hypothetical protein [Portunus trituberculatus]
MAVSFLIKRHEPFRSLHPPHLAPIPSMPRPPRSCRAGSVPSDRWRRRNSGEGEGLSSRVVVVVVVVVAVTDPVPSIALPKHFIEEFAKVLPAALQVMAGVTGASR